VIALEPLATQPHPPREGVELGKISVAREVCPPPAAPPPQGLVDDDQGQTVRCGGR
jgi:hypothetical protein